MLLLQVVAAPLIMVHVAIILAIKAKRNKQIDGK
jgi:hypothetical protein